MRITTAADGTSATTTILVDGVDLLELQPRLRRLDATVRPGPPGLFRPADPVGLLPPDSRVLLPSSEPSGAMVGICSCGEPGDGSLWLQVRRAGDQVLWEPWPDTPDTPSTGRGRSTCCATEWTELVVGEALDPALFVWDGPTRSAEDGSRARIAEAGAAREQRRAWFTEHVLDGPLRVAAELELDTVNEESGTVTASFGRSSVVLHRRPRSDDEWAAHGRRWSTERWDWAVEVPRASLAPDALLALQAQLPD